MSNAISENQAGTIKDNLHAYEANFETPFIIYDSASKGFEVYRTQEEFRNGQGYVQFCYNISYLDGWLYGAVQAKCKQIRSI
jgi:hypothetical protein